MLVERDAVVLSAANMMNEERVGVCKERSQQGLYSVCNDGCRGRYVTVPREFKPSSSPNWAGVVMLPLAFDGDDPSVILRHQLCIILESRGINGLNEC